MKRAIEKENYQGDPAQEARLDFLFQNLHSGKTADQVYQELDSKFPSIPPLPVSHVARPIMVTPAAIQMETPPPRTFSPAEERATPVPNQTPKSEIKPYTFSEIPQPVYGLDFTATVVKEGVVIGNRLGVKYRRFRGNLITVEFIPFLNGHPQTDRFEEEMLLFRRYHYHSSSVDVSLRGTMVKYEGRPFLHFQIGSPFTMVRTRKLGIEL